MTIKLLRGAYPSLVGLLLGLFQIGLFFQLTFALSSSFSTFLLVTLCWLLGSALGAFYLARLRWRLRVFLIMTLAAYATCSALLIFAPFNGRLWPGYAALITLSGIFPGVFFARMAPIFRARVLLFRENNGFVAGIVLGTLLFLAMGRTVLWIAPAAIAAVVYLASD